MKIFVSELTQNQTISTTFLVKSKELRSKKTGGQFALLTLGDKTGDIVAQWWDNFEESIDTFDRDDIVFVRGLVNSYRNHLQLTIHRARLCQDNEIDLTHYFPTTKYDVEQMFAELKGIIGEFANPHLKRLLENIFSDEETARKFKRAPAAKTMHHPYLGGLLEHSLSLVKLCRNIGNHYAGIDVDLLVTGAVLHDFGKIDELSYDRAFSYTNDGQMIGHLVMETMMVADRIREVDGFPEELRRHLLHMLLAHHGKLEYGSPKLPSTPEALILAYLDDLDSKVEAMQRLISEPHASGDWTRISPILDRSIYRVRTIDSPVNEEVKHEMPATQTATTQVSRQAAEKPAPAQKKASAQPGTFNNPFQSLGELLNEKE